MTTEHLWQPYPFSVDVLFQCAGCGRCASTARSALRLPVVCPGRPKPVNTYLANACAQRTPARQDDLCTSL